ncbi:MAG: hypothetical protein SGI72_01910 [Planctomycetota bacterium]|nr:hypothetical protein [Planctomycetota bacterium]
MSTVAPLAVYASTGSKSAEGSVSWSSDRIDFGEFPAGQREVSVSFERDVTSENVKASKWIALREPFATTVEIKDGETTRVVVP